MTYEDYQKTTYFRGLDGIRALAVIGTVFAHAPNIELWDWIDGPFGVVAFFVLSGFLITTLLLREERAEGSIHYLPFLIRRAFRLFPAYYTVLFIYFLMVKFKIKTDLPRNVSEHFFYLFFYLQELMPLNFFYHAWSLGVEEKFYFALPMLGFKFFKHSQFRWWLTYTPFICLALLADHYIGAYTKRSYILAYGSLVWGSLLGVLLHSERFYKILVPLFGRFAISTLLIFIASFPIHEDFLSVRLIAMMMFGVLMMAVVTGGLPSITNFLESRWLVSMGRYSYFMYLIHLILKNVALKICPSPTEYTMLNSFINVVLTTALSYMVAAVSFKYFESPLIRYGHKLSARYKQRKLVQQPL